MTWWQCQVVLASWGCKFVKAQQASQVATRSRAAWTKVGKSRQMAFVLRATLISRRWSLLWFVWVWALLVPMSLLLAIATASNLLELLNGQPPVVARFGRPGVACFQAMSSSCWANLRCPFEGHPMGSNWLGKIVSHIEIDHPDWFKWNWSAPPSIPEKKETNHNILWQTSSRKSWRKYTFWASL